ncbi:MAG: iron(III) transport system substrate-binding protein [Chloroflexota bacterium]|nr:iron(III) transport system substrate-binding protein [Chloroflexota bacterium]
MKRANAGLLVLALIVLACGAPPTAGSPGAPGASAIASQPPASGTAASPSGQTEAEKVYAKLGPGSGAERLLEAAKAEGELTLYTSMTSDVIAAVSGAFTDKYGIDVNVYRAGSETVLQRVDQEQKANFQGGNDVVETNFLEMFEMSQLGYLSPFPGDAKKAVVQAGQFDNWTATRFNNFVVSWNTNLVPAGQEPKSWEDLADPKWKGKISMEAGDFDWFLSLWSYWKEQGKTDDEIGAIFKGIASNSLIVTGLSVQGELLAAGEFSVAVSNYSYLVERVRKAGGPVAWKPTVQPVIARPNGVGLMRTASHPAAALLFTDWLLTDGQKVIAEQGLTPSTPVAGDDQLAGLKIIPVDIDAIATDAKKWEDMYDELLKAGTQKSG